MLKRLLVVLVTVFVLVGCNSTYKKLISEAETSVESGDFDQALKVYKSALDEVPESTEVKGMIKLLEGYNDLLKKMDDLDWTEASDLANDLVRNDAIPASLEKKVNELVSELELEQEKEEKEITSELSKIEKMIQNDDVGKASLRLSELEDKVSSEAFDKEIEELYSYIEVVKERSAEKERIKQEKDKKAADKKSLEEKSKQQASTGNNLKSKYLQKAAIIDAKMRKELANYSEVPNGLIGDFGQEWDDLLNEVWGVLKSTMPSNEFEILKAEQIKWIQQKENGFAEIGDSIASQRAIGWDYLSEVTEERTYYLIERYLH